MSNPVVLGYSLDSDAQRTWEGRQRKVFSKWAQAIIRTNNRDFDIVEDLHSGASFFELVEALTGKDLPFSWAKKAKKAKLNRVERINLIQQAFDFLQSNNNLMLDLSPTDLHNKNVKLIMGMVWQFILKFQIIDKAKLLEWCKTTCAQYDITIKNFTNSWTDGRGFCALVSFLAPNCISEAAVKKLKKSNAEKNLNKAFEAAEEMGLTRVLEPEDLLDGKPNERVIILYLSYFYNIGKDGVKAPEEPVVDQRDEEIEYLRKEVERLVMELRDVKKKYESLRLRTKEETEYLIHQQKAMAKQMEKIKSSKAKMDNKVKMLQNKLKLMETEKLEARGNPPPEDIITIVCSGVYGSAKLWDACPDEMGQAIPLYNTIIRSLAREHKGYEVKCEGGAFTHAFGSPSKALRFTMEAQLALLKEEWPKALLEQKECEIVMTNDKEQVLFKGLRMKIGMHTGEPKRQEDSFSGHVTFFGPEVSRAEALVKAAAGGQVLVTNESWLGMVNRALKMKTGPTCILLGEFSFSELSCVEEVCQVLPKEVLERYFPPILTDANLDAVSQVLADELQRLADENAKLKNELKSLEDRAKDSQERASLMQKYLESMSIESEGSNTEEFLTISRDLNTLTKEKEEMMESIENLRMENEQLQSYLQQLNNDLSEAKRLGSGLQDKLKYIKSEKDAANKRIKELHERVNTLTAKQINEALRDWGGEDVQPARNGEAAAPAEDKGKAEEQQPKRKKLPRATSKKKMAKAGKSEA
mmetsp:Transcript_31614/g.88629  ORF Transcript_31614/g.88629 Transcript_31614/m.88629 type:complete len:755 (+) Transcript_31614:136-2400(+)